jgi:histidyl-tRNA synthetase
MSDKNQLRTPKGVHDILPDDHDYHTFIKKVVRHRLRQAGFRRISTPVFESTDVFQRSIGDDTDIVQKEMYTFEDRKGRSLTLKPESTAGVVRAYIQNGLSQLPQPVELYYIEPHFRYDRPQKGRYRQFWQFGFEVIGESNPALDAQVIHLAHKIHEDLGVGHLLDLQLNTIGTAESREKYQMALKDFYIGKERSLCEDCQNRLHTNTMRLLDCKEEDCQILAELAPKMVDFIDEESKKFHENVKDFLTEMDIEFTENPKLVRGLDYYSKTVFEFWNSHDGAQNSVGGGGRYDGLVQLLGGPPTPAVGYAGGMERVIAAMKREKVKVPKKDTLHAFVVQLGKEAKLKCLPLMNEMRERGIKTMGALGKDSLRDQLSIANKFKAPYAVIVGLTEVREEVAIIRDMSKGTQETVPFDKTIDKIIKKIGEKHLDKYSPGEIIY